jgi:hypothetical protein
MASKWWILCPGAERSTGRRTTVLPSSLRGGFSLSITQPQATTPAWDVNGCNMIWLWVNTYRYIFNGMNIHLPAILMFTRGTRFWHTATSRQCLVFFHHRHDIYMGRCSEPARSIQWKVWMASELWIPESNLLLSEIRFHRKSWIM